MKIIRKNTDQFPYHLNDAHIMKVKLKEDKIKVYFDRILFLDGNEQRYVNGYITFRDVDYDYCSIYTVKFSEKKKKLKEKKYSIESFMKKNKGLDMEIIKETINDNYTVWNGWIHKDEDHKEDIMISIWNEGKVVYHVEDET